MLLQGARDVTILVSERQFYKEAPRFSPSLCSSADRISEGTWGAPPHTAIREGASIAISKQSTVLKRFPASGYRFIDTEG